MEEARGPSSPRVVAPEDGKGEHWTVSPADQVVFPDCRLPSPAPRFPLREMQVLPSATSLIQREKQGSGRLSFLRKVPSPGRRC